jgi:nuclease S1
LMMSWFRTGSALLGSIALLLARPIHAHAWGYEAHRIIAEIAEQFLAPETAHRARELLALENVTTLAEVSTWADEIRLQRPGTGPWHYVNIPIILPTGEPAVYDAARDCPKNACVVAKIEQFERELTDRQLLERQRLEALKFIVHFIGDAHQPLHVSNNHDRGGNDDPVIFMGLPTNLHAVWDSGIIWPAVGGDERAYALQLVRSIRKEEHQRWSEGSLISWVNEAHEIAARTIYGELPHSGKLPDDYETKALPIVNEQLERAGVRLATVLNACLE